MGEFAFQTLRESITSAIRSKILTGELQPGVKLAEQKLAEEFGSSRAPIREALRQLEQEGMVEYSRNVGCSVRRVKPEDAYEIYLLRANLEMTALRYFDCKFPEEDLHTLRGILEEMRNVRPGDLSQIVENDNRFHAVIVQRAGLPRLLKFWEDLNYCGCLQPALVGANSGLRPLTTRRWRSGRTASILTNHFTEALGFTMSGDTAVFLPAAAVYAHYMEPMEKEDVRSANSAGKRAVRLARQNTKGFILADRLKCCFDQSFYGNCRLSTMLDYAANWALEPGKDYFVCRNGFFPPPHPAPSTATLVCLNPEKPGRDCRRHLHLCFCTRCRRPSTPRRSTSTPLLPHRTSTPRSILVFAAGGSEAPLRGSRTPARIPRA